MCPQNIEATLYATLISTINMGKVISNYFGGLVLDGLGISATNFDNLWIAIIIANTFTLIPLICINIVDI